MTAIFYSNPDSIQIHKYDADGKLLASHSIDPGHSMGSEHPVVARHTSKHEIVYVAWDNRKSETAAATQWSVASAQFKQVPSLTPTKRRRASKPSTSTSTSAQAVAKGPAHASDVAVIPKVWRGKTLTRQTVAGGDHDFLVDMDVSPTGQPYLVGVDQDAGAEYIRLTTLSRYQGGAHETVRYRRSGRDARPTHMFAGENMIYVLGQDDALPGPNTGDDTDVLYLVFWKQRKPKRAAPRKARARGSNG